MEENADGRKANGREQNGYGWYAVGGFADDSTIFACVVNWWSFF